MKFRIMLQMCQDNYDEGIKNSIKREFGYEWNAEDMQKASGKDAMHHHATNALELRNLNRKEI